MRKKSLIAILVLAFGTMMPISMINPAEAYIDMPWYWFGQIHDYDPYWDIHDITVFPNGTTATLMVRVHNTYGVDLNVSSVEVVFDWTGGTYSYEDISPTNPLVMPSGTFHTFTITFTVPSTSIASNLVPHAYRIIVEEVNATSGPWETSVHDAENGYNFVVYSTVQKDAMRLYDEIDVIFDLYGPWFGSVLAQSLWDDGEAQYELGLNSYISGDFANAKTHYESARDMLYEAISTELSHDLDDEEYDDDLDKQWDSMELLWGHAELNLIEAYANATMAQGEAMMISANASMKYAEAEFAKAEAIKQQSNAYIVFGVGFIVFGFAACIWAYRRPIGPPS